jgi:bifunctional DNase/RNase
MKSSRRLRSNIFPILCLIPWLSFGLLRQGHAAPNAPANLLELQVKGITVDPNGNVPIVILEALTSHKAFPMWIGKEEAQAIAIELQGVPMPRPLTHMLLRNILTNLQVKVERIVIHDLQDNTFFASIFLQQGQSNHTIDARPSDAIALAIAAKAPIFVAPHVLQAVQTIPTSPAEATPKLVAKKFGMHMQTLDERLARAFQLPHAGGVLVASVDEHSQAAQAGVHRGDIIMRVDDQVIKTLDDLMAVLTTEAPEQHRLNVIRQQREVIIRLQPPAK